ncbi:MAG: enoyl-CoA hydratase/isomerase family protein [Methanomassiliicoccales archaeon]|nr:MAG: enoyl-CoA hydratase/isomerase family protein [Methanomassiliicoccales archaeon]
MELNNVVVEKENNLAVLFINRPKALNALNSETLSDIGTAARALTEDDDVGVVIITGMGEKAFVAGADIKEMKDMSPLEARRFMIFGQSVFNEISNLPKPTIAAVNGFALGGGCELALSCDMIIASENAKFGLPEVTLGIHPGFGGTQRLPRLIGAAKAKELIFTGQMIDASEASKIGLVNKVVPYENLLDVAKALAHKILKNGQVAIRLVKSAINAGLDTTLEKGLAYEAETQGLAFSTEDKSEGLSAFMEKRKPNFKGR